MTNQEIFEKVVIHLRKQGSKAVNSKGHCCYLTPDGKKCAAGCLIDEYYVPLMEDKTFVYICQRWPKLKEKFDPENIKLIDELQSIHDGFDVEFWEEKFQEMANKWKLSLPGNGK